MDFIKQLKAFDEQSYRKVTPNAYVIYFKLFMINNNMHWEEWFEVSDSEITFRTGIKRRESIVRALNLLKQHGFLDFRRGGSGRTTSYKIIPLSNSATSYQQRLLNSASDSASLENPLINNKNVNVNGNVNNKPARVDVFASSGESEKVKALLKDFDEMRNKKRNPMTDKARELLLKKLDELSGGDEFNKIHLLEQSIEHGWQSVYPLKQDKPEFQFKGSRADIVDRAIAMAESLEERRGSC